MKRKFLLTAMSMLLTLALATGCATTETKEANSSDTTVTEATTEKAVATDETVSDGTPVQPEGFPSTNIEFLVTAPGGAMIDVAMRALSNIVDFGEPVVVINKDGAGQSIGLTEVFAGGDDPYVITSAGFSGYIIQPEMITLPYAVDDFRYIALNHPAEPQLIVSNATSKYQSWQDVLDAVAAGEEVTYSAANPNGLGRIALLEVASQEEIDLKFIPFSGSSEGFAALLGDHIDFYIIDASVAVPKVEENQFTGLMVVGPDHLTTIPDVPSALDLGITGMEKFVGYTAIAMNKEVPDEYVAWIKYKIDQAQQSDAYKSYLKDVVGTEEPLKVYTEEELTAMVLATNEAIVNIMEKYGLGQ